MSPECVPIFHIIQCSNEGYLVANEHQSFLNLKVPKKHTAKFILAIFK